MRRWWQLSIFDKLEFLHFRRSRNHQRIGRLIRLRLLPFDCVTIEVLVGLDNLIANQFSSLRIEQNEIQMVRFRHALLISLNVTTKHDRRRIEWLAVHILHSFYVSR